MADSNIGALPPIETLLDDALMIAEQQGVAGHVTGLQFKQFARIGVSEYVEAAQSAAENALEASQQALDAVKMVEGAADEAAAAQAASLAAQAAQTTAEAAQVAAETARDQAQAIAGGNFLSLAGGTLTGPLVLAGAPAEDNEAATKKYVDDNVAANGGKEEIFLTTITYDSTSKTYSADHTYAEILEAHNAGKICICTYGNARALLRDVSSGIDFTTTPLLSNGYVYGINISSDNVVSTSGEYYVSKSQIGEVKSGEITDFTADSDSVTDLSCTVNWQSIGRIVCAHIDLSATLPANTLQAVVLTGPAVSMPGSVSTKHCFLGGPSYTTGYAAIYDVIIYSQRSSSIGDNVMMEPNFLISMRDGSMLGINLRIGVSFSYYIK